MRVAIIGGGIAGLAAAYELELARLAGCAVEYELYEASERLGGVIASAIVDGTVLELGPDSFLTEKPAAMELCRELGLASEFVPSNDAERRTYIVVRNRLVAMPDGLMFLIPTKLLPTLLTPLFSLWTKLRMGLELLAGKRSEVEDESVASLVRRHYGQGVVDRLADPLLSGIYGGDAEQLSARAVLPRLVAMEAQYGSLTWGTLAGMRERMLARQDRARAGEAEEVKPAIFTTLRHGLQQLVDALVVRLDGSRLHVQAPVQGIRREGAKWSVAGEKFDAVIVATPAWAAAELVRDVDAELASELAGIPYSSSITVNVVYDGVDLDPLPPGFGFLVPKAEGRAMLACTFIHRKFSGRTASGKTVLRVFLGGAGGGAVLAESDEFVAELVLKELFEILQISAVPEQVAIRRWPRAMAQYAVGHGARMGRIQGRLVGLPGLHLVGNAYDGIGISDCIRLGRGAARAVVEQ